MNHKRNRASSSRAKSLQIAALRIITAIVIVNTPVVPRSWSWYVCMLSCGDSGWLYAAQLLTLSTGWWCSHQMDAMMMMGFCTSFHIIANKAMMTDGLHKCLPECDCDELSLVSIPYIWRLRIYVLRRKPTFILSETWCIRARLQQ